MHRVTLDALIHATCDYLRACRDCRAFWPVVDVRPNNGGAKPVLAVSQCLCPLDALPELLSAATNRTANLVQQVVAHADTLEWFQVYKSTDPVGKGKFDRTAVAMLCGEGAAYIPAQGLCGFYYLQKDVEYAAHAHAPREIYAILSGTARYWNEATGWETRGPGDVIQTPEESWHAMATPWEPVLILWAWIGQELDRAPRLRAPDGALPPGAFDIDTDTPASPM